MASHLKRGTLLFSAALALAGASGAAFAQAEPPSGVQCYPGTDENPLEAEVVVKGSGGTFWETFDRTVLQPFAEACGVEVTLTATSPQPFSQTIEYVERGQVPWDVSFINKPWEYKEGIDTNTFQKFPDGFWDPIKTDLYPGAFDDYTTWLSYSGNVMIYNTDVFPNGLPDWKAFWDTATYPGPRTMQDSPYNLIIALLADGVAPEDIYPIGDEKLRRAFNMLNELRPNISSFWTATDQPIQGTHRGDFVAGIAYSGRAMAGIQNGYRIAINWAGNVTQEAWFFVPRGTQNPLAAQALLFFFNQHPEIQAEVAKATGYAYANRKMNEYLSEAQVEDLATSHADEGVVAENAWWAENGPRVSKMWSAWVANGDMPL